MSGILLSTLSRKFAISQPKLKSDVAVEFQVICCDFCFSLVGEMLVIINDLALLALVWSIRILTRRPPYFISCPNYLRISKRLRLEHLPNDPFSDREYLLRGSPILVQCVRDKLWITPIISLSFIRNWKRQHKQGQCWKTPFASIPGVSVQMRRTPERVRRTWPSPHIRA